MYVWIPEFLRRYVTGDHAVVPSTPADRARAATAAVFADIDREWSK
jgi:hypothetical protein